ncbi:MAG: hypothetical protein ACK56J_11270 [Planctomycetota bacterium]|jgi:hypothetical protein
MSNLAWQSAVEWFLGGGGSAALTLRANMALLLMGVACFAGGILLMIQHRREWIESLGDRADSRTRRYEERKFRRRSLLASMISSAGCVMASLYWLVEPRLWATMMGVLLLILVGIVGIAFLDLFSVSLREISQPNPEAQQEMVRTYLELREKRRQEQAAAEEKTPAEEKPD